jgi:hypothetical protein
MSLTLPDWIILIGYLIVIAAIRAYQQRAGMTPDGFATARLLQSMR